MKISKVILFIMIPVLSGAQSVYEFPFRDPALPDQERIEDILSRLTLEEKVLQLFNKAPAIERLGIPRYDWRNECLHGLARAGRATVFPQAIGMAATFDEELMHRIGTAISDEARAKHHYHARHGAREIFMGITFWSPNINIFRDPRWGRGQETYGEDPYLSGRMGAQFINGLQGDHPDYYKTIATAKHYAVHNGPEHSRHSDNFFVNDRDLYETYLPAFEIVVKKSNVQSVMCAYNRFRDQPCCGSYLLLDEILRRDMDFQGYVTTDCGAVRDFFMEGHHEVVETPAQALGWALAAGSDLICGDNFHYLPGIDSAVRAGIVVQRDIDRALRRLFQARIDLGMFDPPEMVPYTQIPLDVVGSKKHLELTGEAARKSLVLLKNNGILPLKNVRRLAVIGPNAHDVSMLLGNYHGDPVDPVTPLEGLQEKLGRKNVVYSAGCQIVPGMYSNYSVIPPENFYHCENGRMKNGLQAEYFEDTGFAGEPDLVRIDKNIDFYWELTPINKKVDESFAVRWSGLLRPTKTGTYRFGGNTTLWIDDRSVTSNETELKEGEFYHIVVERVVKPNKWASNLRNQHASLTWVETSGDYREEALAAAGNAEVIVFCGGISPRLEGEQNRLQVEGFEYGDRTGIDLPGIQLKLLKELHRLGKPLVYVNFSGSAMAMNWEEENLDAIIQAFYPGEKTGSALADLLVGDYSPSGRLPVTFYRSVDDLPPFRDYRMEGRTYKYYRGDPLYEFGYGLSYTRFAYTGLKVPDSVTAGEPVPVSAEVTNAGDMQGDEVIQLYITDLEASSGAPLLSLAGIKRVSLEPGQTRTVQFTIEPGQLSLINADYRRVIEPGRFRISVGGKQPDKSALNSGRAVQSDVTVTGRKFVMDRL